MIVKSLTVDQRAALDALNDRGPLVLAHRATRRPVQLSPTARELVDLCLAERIEDDQGRPALAITPDGVAALVWDEQGEGQDHAGD
ncbi:MAG: hypothetical protein M0P31_13870 [Solirubrobacteraceae bacterium]|nr:hypothetical protein [Solirubrobacteraceae bacterium]